MQPAMPPRMTPTGGTDDVVMSSFFGKLHPGRGQTSRPDGGGERDLVSRGSRVQVTVSLTAGPIC
jgi:hypothetical protein